VEAEPHVGRSIGGDTSQQANVGLEQGCRIATLDPGLPAHVRVAQHGDRHLVELHIAAAGSRELG
jgi:hypothetical protein